MAKTTSSKFKDISRPWPLLAAFLCINAFFAVKAFEYIFNKLPPKTEILKTLNVANLEVASEVFDRHGTKIGEFAAQRRYYLRRSEIPQKLIAAFIAIEDRDFYQHHGVDLIAMLRAMAINLSLGEHAQGASTITQQVARMYFLSPKKTYVRKINEILLSLRMEQYLSKDQILEFYLNKVYLGKGCHGVKAAARSYFGKEPRELRIAEAAFIAGLAKAPSFFGMQANFKLAKRRQRAVLRQMYRGGFIDAKTYEKSLLDDIVFKQEEDQSATNGYVLALVRHEIEEKLALPSPNKHGFKIYTTLDASVQLAAKASLVAGAHAFNNKDLEAALVSIEIKDNSIIALVGGLDFNASEYNRSVKIQRPIGKLRELLDFPERNRLLRASPMELALAFSAALNPHGLRGFHVVDRVEGIDGRVIYANESKRMRSLDAEQANVSTSYEFPKGGKDFWLVGGQSGMLHVVWYGSEFAQGQNLNAGFDSMQKLNDQMQRYVSSAGLIFSGPELEQNLGVYSKR